MKINYLITKDKSKNTKDNDIKKLYLEANKKNIEKFQNNIKQFNNYINKKEWINAYNLYISMYESQFSINNFVYDGLITLLINVNYLEMNDNSIDKVLILFNNFIKFFAYCDKTSIIIKNMIQFINNNKYKMINKLFDFSQDIYGQISDTYNNEYQEDLHELNVILYDIYFINMAHMYQSKQIISTIKDIINKLKYQNNDYVKIFYVSILMSFDIKDTALEVCNMIYNKQKRDICYQHINNIVSK